jgi:hypothetical protein
MLKHPLLISTPPKSGILITKAVKNSDPGNMSAYRKKRKSILRRT